MNFNLSPVAKAVLPLCSVLMLSACFDDSDDTVNSSTEIVKPSIDIVIPEVNGVTATVPQSSDVNQPITALENEAVIYLAAKNGTTRNTDYANYSLHIWNNDACDRSAITNNDWNNTSILPENVDEFGPYWRIPLKDGVTDCINFIIRDANLGNMSGGDAKLEFSQITDRTASYIAGSTKAYNERGEAYAQIFGIANAEAHLVESHVLVWDGAQNAEDVRLYLDLEGGISSNEQGEFNAQYVKLTPTELSTETKAKLPHLANKKAFAIDTSINMRPIIKAQLVAIAVDEKGVLVSGTKVQTAKALDHLFADAAKDIEFGAIINGTSTAFKLWAPSAQNVMTVLFDEQKQEVARLQMAYDENTGVWSIDSEQAISGTYYRYAIDVYHPVSDKVESYQVTDPYSLSLSMNSEYSQVVDLADPSLKPAGWDSLERPVSQENPAKFVIYEAHVRDFSALDQSTDEEKRGKFAAFTQTDSVPFKHLKSLSESGVTHLHLLPIFDIATINEDANSIANIDENFSKLCNLDEGVKNHATFGAYCSSGKLISEVFEELKPQDSADNPIVQELNRFVSNNDSFNWGYDPFHYTVPEGSYSSNPDGITRIKELREAVMSIKNDIGMNVVMDVVYNHTNSDGPTSRTSVLDKIVPWYYQRLNPITGATETSTCCSNTAPEHAMFEKMISDSLIVWSREYKIDAYRFDLMGHHPLDQMQRSLEAVKTVDPQTYFYGEGWDFGEVAGDALFKQARQIHLGGTGIGSFSDRLRDAMRGGAFNTEKYDIRKEQGFGNGAFVLANELNGKTKEQAMHLADLVRLGMAGNLKDFVFEDYQGVEKTGDKFDYAGAPAGYAVDPTEIQNYVSKHDNQTLWDFNQYKLPYSLTTQQRVRVQATGLATVMLGQGMPFTHQGVELLRSKSMQRDSYDSGDLYNFVDYTLEDNNWDKGLPRVDKDGGNYPLIEEVLRETGDTAKPQKQHMEQMVTYYKELATLRKNYPLLSLGKGEEVKSRIKFHNTGVEQIPGLIVMSIDNSAEGLADLDTNLDALIVVINATNEPQVFAWNKELVRSPLHQSDLAYNASYIDGHMVVPAWTPVVFEQKRQ